MFKGWKLNDYEPGEGVHRGANAELTNIDDWVDVTVPGDVHQAMIACGRIPDPFYDRNEAESYWMEEREWWYRTRFTIEKGKPSPEERLLLIFHGLDTYVTVWLNGEELGTHANMFREAVFDITDRVYFEQLNTLALCFEPPLYHMRDQPSLAWEYGTIGEPKRNLMRKAQFGYGWDWGPRLPTIGIWRPVELRRQRCASIQGVHFATLEVKPSREEALVTVRVEVDHFAGEPPTNIEINLIDPRETEMVAEEILPLAKIADVYIAETSFSVVKPSLWWTHDLGEPALYKLEVRLLREEKELDRHHYRVGIRTVELDQTPDPAEPGTNFFRFVLNGVPIFCRGANWIPASSFVGGLTAGRYSQLLSSASDANMNMLRIWGGGIYEHDVFYEICDQLGILIWQDFMFACAPYSEDDPEFVDEVKAEVSYQVRRLRNHPCLALWCGNNENQWIHRRLASEEEREKPVPGNLYYAEVMPETVEALDKFTPYWPGSPFGGPGPNSMSTGDVHDWHVWHGFPVSDSDDELPFDPVTGPAPEDVSFVHYEEDMGRFISEFGMHASPVLETLRRCIPSNQLYHHSPSLDHHNKDNPKSKGDNLMLTVTGLPKDLDEYIDFSMISQAEGLKFGIEHFRRRKPHCSGTLFWQFNDCWPVLSWSVLDYYGFGKAGYFYVRRAYAPILASFKSLDDGAVELWVTNDSLADIGEGVVIQLGSFSSGKIWEKNIEVKVAANSSLAVWKSDEGEIVAQSDHYLAVRSQSEHFPANRLFFAAVKDLPRSEGKPDITITSQGEHEVRVHIHAPSYFYYVHLLVSEEHTQFSDNYFDLIPGESRTIIVTNEKSTLNPEMILVKWR